MRKALLVVLILCSAVAWATGGACTGQKPLDGVTTGGYLKGVANASVRVCSDTLTPCTAIPLFSDAALTQSISNPVTTDATGNYQYCAAAGSYNEQISGSAFSTVNNTPVTLAGSGDVTQAGNNTFTGTNIWNGNNAFNGITTGVISPLPASFVMVEAGDSICANVPVNRWSDQVATMSQFSGRVTANHNTCVSGRTIADIQAGYTTEVYPYRPAVTGLPTYLFVAVGTNCLSDAGAGATSCFSQIQTYWATAKADGFTIVAFTVLPRGSSALGNYYSNNIELYNDSVRADAVNSHYDVLVDEWNILQNPYNGTFFNTADFTHPTQAGQLRIAQYINSIFGGTRVAADTWHHKPAFGSFACDQSSLWQSTGTFNVGCGYQTLTSNTTGVNNFAAAPFALKANTTGNSNIAIGYQALNAATTVSNQFAIGALALNVSSTGVGNGALGFQALKFNTTGSNNYAIGMNALANNVGGSNNSALGTSALLNNITGNNNIANGLQAATAVTSGGDNIAIGVQSMQTNQTGSFNTVVGSKSFNLGTAGSNSCLGYFCLNATTGTGDTAIGASVATKLTTGIDNVVIGRIAGDTSTIANANVSGSQNVWVGTDAGPGTTTQLSNSIAIGYQARNTASNQVVLGNSSITQTVLHGLSISDSWGTSTNCTSAASPAACSSAPAGMVVIAAAGTTVVVNTTKVTANSEIFLQEDSSLGSALGVTCNTTLGRSYVITARTAATSFTITSSAAPATNPACLSFTVIN